MSHVHTKLQLLETAMEEYGELLIRLALTYVKNRQVAMKYSLGIF